MFMLPTSWLPLFTKPLVFKPLPISEALCVSLKLDLSSLFLSDLLLGGIPALCAGASKGRLMAMERGSETYEQPEPLAASLSELLFEPFRRLWSLLGRLRREGSQRAPKPTGAHPICASIHISLNIYI